jgi:hypothetical protein
VENKTQETVKDAKHQMKALRKVFRKEHAGGDEANCALMDSLYKISRDRTGKSALLLFQVADEELMKDAHLSDLSRCHAEFEKGIPFETFFGAPYALGRIPREKLLQGASRYNDTEQNREKALKGVDEAVSRRLNSKTAYS